MAANYYGMGCEDDVGEEPKVDHHAVLAARLRGEAEKTAKIMSEINGKIIGSNVRKPFKDIWADFHRKWLDFSQDHPALKTNGKLAPESDLKAAELDVLDYRKKALLIYESWKREKKTASSANIDGETIDKNLDKWRMAKFGLGILAIFGTGWGLRKLYISWRDDRHERQRVEREEKRIERLERLGLIESTPSQPAATQTVTPVTIVMPQGAMMSGAPQVAVSGLPQAPQALPPVPVQFQGALDVAPVHSGGPRQIASRVMKMFPPTPSLFPPGSLVENDPEEFPELPDGFSQP